MKNPLFFDPLYRARQGPLYSACRDQCFTVLPLNRLCLVWVYLPIVQNPCQTEADPFCPFCAPQTHFVLLHAATFPATMLISSLLTLRACTQRFPLKFSLLGGSSSQQDVPPQRGLSRGRIIDPFPSPHHQTTPPLPLTSGPWPHHVLYWLGTGW